MGGLRILIVNTTLATLTGTEKYVRDLALALAGLKHLPMVYSPNLGPVAEELRAANITVVDNLNALTATPDVIHGNHCSELMTALLRFPSVPGVFFCHSLIGWQSSPLKHPRVLQYVAVDDACRERVLAEADVSAERIRVFLNTVDLERFKRRPPLPVKPKRALVFSNAATEQTQLGPVRDACRRASIQLDVVSAALGSSTYNPESILGQYDLVFAKARCALESMAIGAAVILCDAYGSGPMVTTGELDGLRRFNFGIRTLKEKVTPEALLSQIARYDANDAGEVSSRVRATASLNTLVSDCVGLYREIIEEHRESPAPDSLAEGRAAADYLRWQTITTQHEQGEYQNMLANSLTLRWRNRLGQISLLNKPLNFVGRLARGNGA